MYTTLYLHGTRIRDSKQKFRFSPQNSLSVSYIMQEYPTNLSANKLKGEETLGFVY